MKKKLADEIGKAYKRLHCPHWYWHNASPLETLKMGSFCRGVIVCNNCGKTKLIEELKDHEIVVEWWQVKDYL